MTMTRMNKKINLTVLALALAGVALFTACEPKDPLPRPKGWPRIDLPQHTYQTYSSPACPFTFEFPAIAVVQSQRSDSCIADLYFKDYECKWHFTYRDINGNPDAKYDHFEEYRKLVYNHIEKVTQIQESPIQQENGEGFFYELYGAVGVPAQFFFGDSTHLLMASFYFDEAMENDSLSPVVNWMKEDMLHLVESIRWKE
jgi:gliding motility-associated lipoprotein GldD